MKTSALLSFSLFLTLAFSAPAFAATNFLTLQNLDQDQTDALFKTLVADTVFRPLEGASTFGDIFGFAFGVIGETTSTSQVQPFLPADTPSYVPGGNLFLAAQFPYGLGVEAGFIPQTGISGASFKQYGFDAKWTVNKVLFQALPVDVALRAGYSRPEISYTETVNAVDTVISFNSNITTETLSVSRDFIFVEPYVTLGLIQQSGTLMGTGSTNIFSTTFSQSKSVDRSFTGTLFELGAQFKLGFFNLTAEYGNIFGISSYAGKISFKF